MRHWTVSLMREGRTSRQWHVWAETLTVGSHGAARVRLPLPVEPWALRLTELPEPREFDVGEFHLHIADTTLERSTLWERAQVRIQQAQVDPMRSTTKDLNPTPFGTILVALCLAGITHWTAENFASDAKSDSTPPANASIAAGPSSSILPAPRSPFDTTSPAAPTDSRLLLGGVGASSAPATVRTAIAPHSDSAQWSGSGGGSHSPILANPPPTSPDERLVAAWPDSAAASWQSLDQPPPEPPH